MGAGSEIVCSLVVSVPPVINFPLPRPLIQPPSSAPIKYKLQILSFSGLRPTHCPMSA